MDSGAVEEHVLFSVDARHRKHLATDLPHYRYPVPANGGWTNANQKKEPR
jgi:hypothetical protein